MELTDTHCHLNHEAYDEDRNEVRARAHAVGVMRLLNIGYDRASSRRAVALTEWEEAYAAVGIHPESAEEWGDEAARGVSGALPGFTGQSGRVWRDRPGLPLGHGQP